MHLPQIRNMTEFPDVRAVLYRFAHMRIASDAKTDDEGNRRLVGLGECVLIAAAHGRDDRGHVIAPAYTRSKSTDSTLDLSASPLSAFVPKTDIRVEFSGDQEYYQPLSSSKSGGAAPYRWWHLRLCEVRLGHHCAPLLDVVFQPRQHGVRRRARSASIPCSMLRTAVSSRLKRGSRVS